MVRCGICGIDPDITTSKRCMCPVTLVLCTCGRYVVPGELHEHISDAVDTFHLMSLWAENMQVYHHNEDATDTMGG